MHAIHGLLDAVVGRLGAVEDEHQLAQGGDGLDDAGDPRLVDEPLELEHLEVELQVRLVAELDAEHAVAERAVDRLVVDHRSASSLSSAVAARSGRPSSLEHVDDALDDRHRGRRRPRARRRSRRRAGSSSPSIVSTSPRSRKRRSARLGRVRARSARARARRRSRRRRRSASRDRTRGRPGRRGRARRAAARGPRSPPASRGPGRSITSNMASTDGGGELLVAVEHRVERAVRLDVVERPAVRAQERLERARLVDDVRVQVLGGDRHDAPAEAEQVRQPGMRADRDAVLDGRRRRCGASSADRRRGSRRPGSPS